MLKEMLKYEDLVVQSNIDGFYTKRTKDLTHTYNHRKILIHEVVFDIDCHIRELSGEIREFISQELIKDNVAHQVWDTSRSPHIHCFFKDMWQYPSDVRRDIRALILKQYSKEYFKWIDKNKASENNMIREFNSIHEITGKPKVLIYEYCPDNTLLNPLKSIITEQLRVLYNYKESLTLTNKLGLNIDPEEHKHLLEFVEFACVHGFSQSGMYKNAVYFKNVAIALYLLGCNDDEIKRCSRQMCNLNKGHKEQEIINWIKWIRQQKHTLKVNWNEVRRFYGTQRAV